MTRIVRLIFFPALAMAIPISSSQNPSGIIEDPVIVNEYVRVSRIVLPPASSISLPDNGHVHLLIADHAARLQ